jgi:hypothetical protein
LKRGWGVGEAEEHDGWFEQPFVGDESCFPFVSFFNSDVIVSPADIEFGVERAAIQSVNKFWDERKWVSISDRPLIDGSVILYCA